MKKELIAKFGLTGVTESSSDTEIQNAIQAKMDALSANGKTQMEAAVEAVISGVEKVTTKTYDPGLRAHLTSVGMSSGLDVLQAMLGLNTPTATATLPANTTGAAVTAAAIPVVKNLLTGAADVADDRKGWTWDKWQEEDPDGIEEMEKKDPTSFKALYKAKFKVEPKMDL